MRYFYANSGKFRSLQPILKEWVRLNRCYGKAMLWEESAWWCNERASTGVLAAAAWTYGGVALEEYSTNKTAKRLIRTGRCDLFMNVRKNKFACEVKQIFPRLKYGQTDSISIVKAQFDLACDDARNLTPKEGRRLGICFVTPRFSRSQIPKMEDSLKDYLNCLQQNQKKMGFDAIAWCFPKEGRNMTWKKNDKTYPGIIVLIREVFRSR